MRVQTLPEEFFVCANLQPDRKCVARGLAALLGCGAGDVGAALLALALGIILLQSLTHRLALILHPQEMEGSCLKLVRGAENM